VIPFSSHFKLVNLSKIKVFKRIEESQMKRLPLFFYYFQKSLLFVAVFIFYSGCQNGVENEAKIASLPISISFDRFDLQFYNQEPEVIPDLKKNTPICSQNNFLTVCG
jgi:hypothetical protein